MTTSKRLPRKHLPRTLRRLTCLTIGHDWTKAGTLWKNGRPYHANRWCRRCWQSADHIGDR